MFKTALKVGIPMYLVLDYKRFDRNMLKPLREYKLALQQWNRIQTQEEFHQFTFDFLKGTFLMIPILGHALDQ